MWSWIGIAVTVIFGGALVLIGWVAHVLVEEFGEEIDPSLQPGEDS